MRTAILALALLAALAATACVKLEHQPVEKRFYALETARPAIEAGAPASPATLLVRRLQASPRAAGRELVYRTGESAWTADYYNLFFVAPADMLTQDLRAWLAHAGLFAGVVDPGSLAASGYILEGNLTGLYGDFAAKGPGMAVAEMQFLLLKGAGDERQVLLTREYCKTVPLAGNTQQELVRALRTAVAQVYAALEADLRTTLAGK